MLLRQWGLGWVGNFVYQVACLDQNEWETTVADQLQGDTQLNWQLVMLYCDRLG